MAIALGTILGAAAAAPYIWKGGRALYNKYSKWRDPDAYKRKEVFRQRNITPEQYDLSKRNLQEAMDYLQNPQRVYRPAQATMQQQGNIPTISPIGSQGQAQRLPGLAGRLQGLERAASSGYHTDIASLGSRLSQLNPMGVRSASTLGLFQDAYKNRLKGLIGDQYNLLSQYRTQSGIQDIEGGALDLDRQRINAALMGNQADLLRRQGGLGQSDFLSQQQFNLGQSGLQNLWSNERARMANQQLQYGLRPRDQLTTQP